MKALVTGATGFIGANLVRELLVQRYQVRALVRPGANRRNIKGLNIEVAIGDLLDGPSLAEALVGCDVLFHAAASYIFWSPDPKKIYETNIKGTENILTAARDRSIKKVVYTSTESTIGINGQGLGTEENDADFRSLPGDYKKSKFLAEKLALGMCAEGLEVVSVNPTLPIGPWDVKPTPTGQIIVDFLNRHMPACVDTGLNVVDVGDVAKGHILALEKGCSGQRYILGNENRTLHDIMNILEEITGIQAPRRNIPVWMALSAAYANEFVLCKLRGRSPHIPVAEVRAVARPRYFDCSKARLELGLPQTPAKVALERAVTWFQQNGYVTSG